MMVRDIKGELAALRQRQDQLQAEHAEQLARVVQATGADQLDPTVLAGALLAASKEQSPAKHEEWRRLGEALFRPRRPQRRKDAAPAPPAAHGAGQAPPPGAAG